MRNMCKRIKIFHINYSASHAYLNLPGDNFNGVDSFKQEESLKNKFILTLFLSLGCYIFINPALLYTMPKEYGYHTKNI